MKNLQTTDEIIAQSESLQLYYKLILQLNKDFQRAGIDEVFNETISPSDLKTKLHDNVFHLIQNNYSEYLNLLYIIDVSEKKIKMIGGDGTVEITEQVTFLILQREWQKVWLKDNYSK